MRTVSSLSGVVLLLAMASFAQDADIQAQCDVLKKTVSVGSVNAGNYRDGKNAKFERIKVSSYQDKDDPFVGMMRFTVEIKGDNGDIWFGQKTTKQNKKPVDVNYTGEDFWEFSFPDGELKYPEITGYAVEYGIETNKLFYTVASKLQRVESADEIMERNKGSQNILKISSKSMPQRVSATDAGTE